jgi:hypothetical protein
MKTRSAWVTPLTIILLCLALIGISRFLFASGFGLYEDDYTRIPRALSMSGADLVREVITAFSGFVDHGKPMHPTVIYSLAILGAAINGVQGIYLIAYLVVGLNAVLFFLLMKRISSIRFAGLAGISFAVFSADITQAFLTHALGLQTALTFLLLAFLAYAANRKVLAYIFVLALLLTYETPYFVFLAAPILLDRSWGKRTVRSFLQNALVLGMMLLVIILIRARVEETRISGLTFPEVITIPLSHMIQGPIASLATYVYRPYQAFISLPAKIYPGLLPVFLIIAWAIFRISTGEQSPPPALRSPEEQRDRPGFPQASKIEKLRRWIQDGEFDLHLFISGLMMLVLAYPLTFTVRAYALSGRDTRVHLAAALGAAMLWAWLGNRVLAWFTKHLSAWLGSALLSAGFTLLVGFGLLVQADMVRAWNLQRELWGSIVEYAPDVEEGTVILIDPAGLTDTWAIDANTWAMPQILSYLFQYPTTWEAQPAVHRLLPDWRLRSLWNSQELKAVDFQWQYVVTDWDQTVILETTKDQVSGRLESVELDGERFSLKPYDPAHPAFRANTLYDEFFE